MARGVKPSSDVDAGQHALQVGERGGEEGRVLGGDQQRVVAEFGAAGHERQGNQLLRAEPGQDVAAHGRERGVEAVHEARFLRRALVGHHHAVGVAAAHVGLGVVHRHAVAAAGNDGLDHPAAAGHVVRHLELGVAVVEVLDVVAEGQLDELIAAARHQHLGRCLQGCHHVGGQPQPPPGGQRAGGGCLALQRSLGCSHDSEPQR